MLKRILKIVFITLLSLLLLLSITIFVIPRIYKQEITEKVEQIANQNLNGTVKFDEFGISILKFFPAIIVYVKDLKISNEKFSDAQTVVDAKTAAVGINVYALLKGKIILDAIFIDEANLNLLIDSLGQANFNILKENTSTNQDDDLDTEFKIRQVIINKTNVIYDDKSAPLSFNLTNFYYKGNGDLSAKEFDLNSIITIESFDFIVDNVEYVKNKPIYAEIVNEIDAEELKFKFERNNIKIKNFPFSFDGYFSFIKDGYDFDLNMKSQNSTLEDMLSLVPPDYEDWKNSLNITGGIDFKIVARGKYMQDQSEKPYLLADLKINNGSLSYKKLNDPVNNINIDLKAVINNLDKNQLAIDLNNFEFKLAGNQTKMNFHSKGFKKLKLNTEIQANLDLGKLSKTLNFKKNVFQGKVDLDLVANGTFAKGIRIQKNKIDTIITSIPTFKLLGSLKNGYFKNIKRDKALKNIKMDVNVMAKDSILNNISAKITNLNIEALSNYIRGNFNLLKLKPFNIDTKIETKINLADIYRVYPLDSIQISGNLDLKINAKGILDRKTKKYPATQANLVLKKGAMKYLKYPKIPIDSINVVTTITNPNGTAKDLALVFDQFQFNLAGSPFEFSGKIDNLIAVNYDIKAHGDINLDNLSKIFPIKGVTMSGIISSDLISKGSKNDIEKRNFKNIKNGGQISVKNLKFGAKIFPESFQIQRGTFKFYQDRMYFNDFYASYGKSDLALTGFVRNFLNYVYNRHYLNEQKQLLSAEFSLKSNLIYADEFMEMLAIYTDYKYQNEMSVAPVILDSIPTQIIAETTSNSKGVIWIPKTADLKIVADVKKMQFEAYKAENFTGILVAKNRKLAVDNANILLAGSNVTMDFSYLAIQRKLALFTADIEAYDFDIQRAYKEIPIFAEMVSMAQDAYGTASLNYKIKGALNQDMDLDLKSIDGGGVLTLEDIKFKNFKLLNQVAKNAKADDLEKASFNKIPIETTIKNNVITILPTTMKMAVFRGKLEGQVTLDSKLNLGFRLGLPPFGLINIPMKITGTADDFKIKVGKYREDSSFVSESDLKDDINNDLAKKQAIDSLKNVLPNYKEIDSLLIKPKIDSLKILSPK